MNYMNRSVVLLAFAATSLGGQQPPVTHLSPANGWLTKPFRARSLNQTLDPPRQLRELSDGRVLMGGDGPLFVGDFSTGEVRELTGVRADWVQPLPGDSSIVGSTGWTFLVGERTIGGLPRDNAVVQLVGGGWGQPPHGVDDRGFALAVTPQKRLGDSVDAILVARATGDRDVVARLLPPAPRTPGVFRPVCDVYERALLTPDGWVAVVRLNPYRVDWRSPDGQWTRGAPIPTPTVRMTEGDRQVYLEWRARERPPEPRDSVYSWPETVCPWVGGYAPIAMPDGKLLVYRVPTSQAPATRYDVVNRRGEVERQLAMPASDAILGFGRKSVFVVRTDGQTQKIQRHPWP